MRLTIINIVVVVVVGILHRGKGGFGLWCGHQSNCWGLMEGLSSFISVAMNLEAELHSFTITSPFLSKQ